MDARDGGSTSGAEKEISPPNVYAISFHDRSTMHPTKGIIGKSQSANIISNRIGAKSRRPHSGKAITLKSNADRRDHSDMLVKGIPSAEEVGQNERSHFLPSYSTNNMYQYQGCGPCPSPALFEHLEAGQAHPVKLRLEMPKLEEEDNNNDDGDDYDKEIPTIRLLDGLKIDISNGTAELQVHTDLKKMLQSKKKGQGDTILDRNNGTNCLEGGDAIRVNLENELKLALRSGSKTCSAILRDSWMLSSGSSLTSLDEPDPYEPITETKSMTSAPHVNIPSLDKEPDDSDVETGRNLLRQPIKGTPNDVDKQICQNEKQPQQNNSYFMEKALYQRNVSVSHLNEMPEISIPVFDKRKDYDALDEEIDKRMKEIEQKLSYNIIESQKAIEKLQDQATGTEFRIPQLMTVTQEAVESEEQLEAVLDEEAFVLKRNNYNKISQTKKYSLKNRDISNIFEVVDSRHKKRYNPTSTGKLDLSHITSKINSKPTKNRASNGSAGHVRHLTGTEENCSKPEKLEKVKSPSSASSNCKPSDAKDKQVKDVKKVIKTLVFDDEGALKEEVCVSDLSRKPTQGQYKIPEEVKEHIEKCVRKPPTHKPTSSQAKISHKPRVQSAPVRSKPVDDQNKEMDSVFINKSRNMSHSDASASNAHKPTQKHHDETKFELTSKNSAHSMPENRAEIDSEEEIITTMEMMTRGTSTKSKVNQTKSAAQKPVQIEENKKESRTARIKSAPVGRSRGQSSLINTSKSQNDRSVDTEAFKNMHKKIKNFQGGNHTSVLDRALLPPAKHAISSHLGIGKDYFTSGLLSSPEKWLKE